MPPDYITVPKSEYQSLVREVRRGVEVCAEISGLRITLQNLAGRLTQSMLDVPRALDHAIASCEDVGRLRIELFALERRLREFDQELTPMRPPSQMDIKAAFDLSRDFASGKKKPPGPAGG